jgi:multidrug efflux system outer membrane protein
MRKTLALLLVAGACNFAPTYKRPDAPIPDGFGNASGQGLAAVDRGWRQVFADPRLQRLIEIALANNRDLRIAALNVEVARATYRIERSPLLPQVSGVASANVVGTDDGVSTGLSSYRVGIGVSYELDLWGRVRNASEAALQQYFSTVAAHRAAHLSLVNTVVAQYLRERAYDEERVLAEQTVKLVEEGVALTKRQFDAGQRSDLDTSTAEAQLYAAKAEVFRLVRSRQQAENMLALLIGQAVPSDLPAAQPLETQGVVADLPAGIPSEVLLRRPDVLAAEHSLRAANANIGVARAAFLPQISLTAFGGFASATLGSLFTGGLAWSAGGTLTQPLFEYGRNKATLEVTKLRKLVEVATYEKAIQVAFREVADALVARATLDDQLAAVVSRADAEKRRYQLSEMRYRSGIESYQTVLIAQQDLYATQQQLIELRLVRLVNLADLYLALGGGWRDR